MSTALFNILLLSIAFYASALPTGSERIPFSTFASGKWAQEVPLHDAEAIWDPYIYLEQHNLTTIAPCAEIYKPRRWQTVNFTTFGDDNELLTPNVVLRFQAYGRNFTLSLRQYCEKFGENEPDVKCDTNYMPYYHGHDKANPTGTYAWGQFMLGLWTGTVLTEDGGRWFVMAARDYYDSAFSAEIYIKKLFHSIVFKWEDVNADMC